MSNRIENKDEALKFIEAGGKCQYRHGWGWKGAVARPLTNEDAMNKLPGYDFGEGFYMLYWATDKATGEDVLEFNELGENDMW